MRLSDLKWWHWTLATILIAAVVRIGTGGPLPFVGVIGSKPTPVAAPGRSRHAPNRGPSLVNAISVPGLTIERALPELDRLTVEASLDNPGEPSALLDRSAVLVREIARALQAGVSEDSDAITVVRVLVATQGVDRIGKSQAHLPLYAVDFSAADLYALKTDITPPAEVLNLAKGIVFNGADAHNAARAWCAIPTHLAQAGRFCTMVQTAKGV